MENEGINKRYFPRITPTNPFVGPDTISTAGAKGKKGKWNKARPTTKRRIKT
jgi:hypothetical protein